MKSEVCLTARCVEAIVAHARAEAPRECCGMLIGSGTDVTEAAPARNIAGSQTRFLIDPQDHIDAMRSARQRGLEVLGFYHSHPHSSPVPSETDRADITYPDHLYLIVGLASESPEIRLYRPINGNFIDLAFVTLG